MSSLYVSCFCAAVRQVVEVGGIPYIEYGDEPEPLEDSVPESNQRHDSPVCGQCVNFNPSRLNPASGYCPCTLSRNEWDEVELGKAVTSSDAACSLFELDCPF